jgi:hypothetical protein
MMYLGNPHAERFVTTPPLSQHLVEKVARILADREKRIVRAAYGLIQAVISDEVRERITADRAEAVSAFGWALLHVPPALTSTEAMSEGLVALAL